MKPLGMADYAMREPVLSILRKHGIDPLTVREIAIEYGYAISAGRFVPGVGDIEPWNQRRIATGTNAWTVRTATDRQSFTVYDCELDEITAPIRARDLVEWRDHFGLLAEIAP